MCLTPYTVVRRYRSAQGDLTAAVPCGKCRSCLRRRSTEWAFRLSEEAKVSSSCNFITLTYDDENVPITSDTGELSLEPKHLTDFFKRLRYHAGSGYKIRYYACGEYGSAYDRPHYHAVIFNLPRDKKRLAACLAKSWQKGFIDCGDAQFGSFLYVAKYLQKGRHTWDEDDTRPREFARMSRGLGLSYLSPAIRKFLKATLAPYIIWNGRKIALPRYYVSKVFTREEQHLRARIAEAQAEAAFQENFLGCSQKHDAWVKAECEKHRIESYEQQRSIS